MSHKHLLSLEDWTKPQIESLLKLAAELKAQRKSHGPLLDGQTVAMLFSKPSNRTRVSFEVAVHELGGHPLYLGPAEIGLGTRESVEDVARALSRYVHAAVVRTFSHEDFLRFAEFSSVPVVNALTDSFHPCQILADLMTISEKREDKPLDQLNIVYVGDGNNIANSWVLAAGILGLNFTVCCPDDYRLESQVWQKALALAEKSGAQLAYQSDPQVALSSADVVYTDVWASMGQEEEQEKREKDFADFQVTRALMQRASKDAIFMHCLPAHRGLEVDEYVLDEPYSVVFDQAENRLHVQKAVLVQLMSKER